MADNTVLDAGSGGDTIACDDIGGIKFPRSKLVHGADGTNDGDVSTANPLPVRLYVGTTTTNLGGGVESGAIRVTVASDSTGVLSVDDNGASLTVDNGGTFAVQVDGNALTALQLIDDPVFADDAAFTLTSSKVSMAGAIRDDALATLTAIEGDAVPLRVDSTGALWAVITGTVTVGSHAVTNAGTFAVQAAQSGTWNIGTVTTVSAVTSITNSVTVVGGAASGAAVSGNPVRIGGKTSGGTTYDIITDSDGELIVHQKAAATSLADDANAPLVVPVSENQSAVMYTPTVPYVFDGSTYDRLRGTSADGLLVNLGSNNDVTVTGTVSGTGTAGSAASGVVTIQGVASMTPVQIGDNSSSLTVDNGGTFAVQVDGSALTSLQLIDDTVFADDTAFTPATSKVLAVGFQADETAADSVDEGDIGCPRMTLDRQIRVVTTQESNQLRAGTSTVTPAFAAIAAASSGDNTLATNSNGGKKIRVLAMALVSAGTVNLYFTSDGAGTVIFGGSTNKIALVANTGFVLPFNPLGWFETAANHDVVCNLSGAIAVSGGLVYAEV